MEEKEKYEIDGEAFLMQLLDACAERFNAFGKLAELSAEVQKSDMRYFNAVDHITDFSPSDQVETLESLVKALRVCKKMCEKYNIDISEEKEDEEDGV